MKIKSKIKVNYQGTLRIMNVDSSVSFEILPKTYNSIYCAICRLRKVGYDFVVDIDDKFITVTRTL